MGGRCAFTVVMAFAACTAASRPVNAASAPKVSVSPLLESYRTETAICTSRSSRRNAGRRCTAGSYRRPTQAPDHRERASVSALRARSRERFDEHRYLVAQGIGHLENLRPMDHHPFGPCSRQFVAKTEDHSRRLKLITGFIASGSFTARRLPVCAAGHGSKPRYIAGNKRVDDDTVAGLGNDPPLPPPR